MPHHRLAKLALATSVMVLTGCLPIYRDAFRSTDEKLVIAGELKNDKLGDPNYALQLQSTNIDGKDVVSPYLSYVTIDGESLDDDSIIEG